LFSVPALRTGNSVKNHDFFPRGDQRSIYRFPSRSYGITFWEIMTFGSMPYTGMTNKETMNYVMRGGRLTKPGICPEPVYKLMGSCWKTNPQSRPTFEYIRNKLRLFIQVSIRSSRKSSTRSLRSNCSDDRVKYNTNDKN